MSQPYYGPPVTYRLDSESDPNSEKENSMRTERYRQLMHLFNTADVIQIDSGPLLVHWDLDEPYDPEPDDEIVYASWVDDEGLQFSVKFTARGLAYAMLDEASKSFRIDDHEGEPVTLAFFMLMVAV